MAGDLSLLKRINRMAIVRAVKARPGASRAHLAEATGLAESTVSVLVNELIDEGWLRAEATPGRRCSSAKLMPMGSRYWSRSECRSGAKYSPSPSLAARSQMISRSDRHSPTCTTFCCGSR